MEREEKGSDDGLGAFHRRYGHKLMNDSLSDMKPLRAGRGRTCKSLHSDSVRPHNWVCCAKTPTLPLHHGT